MNKTQIFPLILIVLQIGAGIMYGLSKDWRMMIYWMAASILNIAITF